jgi:hypothetical protein
MAQTTFRTSALEVLVMKELATLQQAESQLNEEFANLRRETKTEQLKFAVGVVRADQAAGRLERLLEAMSSCGYGVAGV